MTRIEEIESAWLRKAVQSNHRYDEKSFKEAIEWADKTMIEKACEWLYVYYPTLERSKSAEDAWDKFKKAMEE